MCVIADFVALGIFTPASKRVGGIIKLPYGLAGVTRQSAAAGNPKFCIHVVLWANVITAQ